MKSRPRQLMLGVNSTVGIGAETAGRHRRVISRPDRRLRTRAHLGNIQVARAICRVFRGNLSGFLSGFLAYPTHT